MSKIEVDLMTVWEAWRELLAIRAMSGVPLDFNGCQQSISEEIFSSIVDRLRDALGDDANPWPPCVED
jgi:hypothetical protein